MGGGPLLLPTFEEKLSSREDKAGGNTSLLGDPQWTHTEEMEILRTFEHTHTHNLRKRLRKRWVVIKNKAMNLSLLQPPLLVSSIPTTVLREGPGMGARALKPSTGQAEAGRSFCAQGQPLS